MMTKDDIDKIGSLLPEDKELINAINYIQKNLGPRCRELPFTNQGVAMGLLILSAEHCWRDGGVREEFLMLAEVAFDHVEQSYKREHNCD